MWASYLFTLTIFLTINKVVVAYYFSSTWKSSKISHVIGDKAQISKLRAGSLEKGDDVEVQVGLLEKERLECFLQKKTRAWEGNWEVLKRKGQVPSRGLRCHRCCELDHGKLKRE